MWWTRVSKHSRKNTTLWSRFSKRDVHRESISNKSMCTSWVASAHEPDVRVLRNAKNSRYTNSLKTYFQFVQPIRHSCWFWSDGKQSWSTNNPCTSCNIEVWNCWLDSGNFRQFRTTTHNLPHMRCIGSSHGWCAYMDAWDKSMISVRDAEYVIQRQRHGSNDHIRSGELTDGRR